ncbi:MAG: type II toxin-antitoxin system prevent-host-death family antitoxin [Lachnospiraceae bacterium]|nr:type II toxin-antitoxin system prevent-host-death family antitoxin [Lachnospiraceae bacterium]
MEITATELKTNLGKYLERVLFEDIWITKNGKTIAKMTNPNVSSVDSISGILKDKISEEINEKTLREARLSRYETNDRY